MTFALWLLGCAVVAVLSRRRPYLAPVAVLAAWVLVPEVARVVLTGSSEGVSGVLAPASWMALICTTALVMGGRMSPSPSPNPTRPWLMLLVAACFLVPIALRGGEGWAFLLDQVVAPLLVFYLVVNASRTDRANAIRMRNAFLALAVFESVLAFLRFAGVIAQPYDTMFAAQYWYNYISTLNRQMGTLDHPLILATLLIGAAALTKGLSPRLHGGLLVMFAAALLLTQSRSGLVLFAVAALSTVVRRRLRPGTIFALILATAGIAWLLTTSWAEGVIGRFSDDQGSSVARGLAFDAFLASDPPILEGQGPGASFEVARGLGLTTSFESWPIMYAIDYGVATTLIYLAMMLWVLVGTRSAVPGAKTAGGLVLVMTALFSSLAVQSSTATLLWFLLGLAASGSVVKKETAAPTRANSLGRVP